MPTVATARPRLPRRRRRWRRPLPFLRLAGLGHLPDGYVNIPADSGVAVSEKKFQLSAPVRDSADGYDLSDYEATQVTISVTQDTQVTSLSVVWYTSPGQEISSGTLDIGQLITAGQSLHVHLG